MNGWAEMTAEEFEAQYAARSGITVEELRAAGLVVVACACGQATCQGWQSVNRRYVESGDGGTPLGPGASLLGAGGRPQTVSLPYADFRFARFSVAFRPVVALRSHKTRPIAIPSPVLAGGA